MAPFSPFRASTRGERLRWYREKTGREQFPLYSPLDSARHAPRRGVGTNYRASMPEE
jgi:hypothetical protein